MTPMRIFLILLVCLTTTVCSFAEQFKIPVLVGQTGASATFGRNETDAYTLAAEEWNAKGGVNGKRVVLQFEDTQTSAKQIISAFQFHVANGAKIIVGPTWLDGFPAVIPVARKNGALLVTPSAAIEAFSQSDRMWPVTFYHNSTIETQVLIDALKERKLSRLALVYEQEPFAEMIRKLLVGHNIELVADIGVQAGESDFRSQLTRLRNKQIEAVIVLVWDERSLLALLQQIQVNLSEIRLATVHDGAGWLLNPALKTLLPRLLYTRFALVDGTFAQRFRSRFGYDPILTASNAYDALNAVLTAVAAGADSGAACRDYLMSHELDSVTFGKFKFNEDGSVPSRVEVVEIP